MGTQDITGELDAENLRPFITRLLHDLQALEAMIDQGAIESGVRRIGAEQELFLVDRSWRPATVRPATLAGNPYSALSAGGGHAWRQPSCA